jgi:hypothetical protein
MPPPDAQGQPMPPPKAQAPEGRPTPPPDARPLRLYRSGTQTCGRA